MRRDRAAVCALALLLAAVAARPARADDTPAKVTSTSAPVAAAVTTAAGAGYGFIFRDDPLSGAPFAADGARVPLVIHRMRQTLIRPRTTFVGALLKTVEGL